jgi:hypothetical protein
MKLSNDVKLSGLARRINQRRRVKRVRWIKIFNAWAGFRKTSLTSAEVITQGIELERGFPPSRCADEKHLARLIHELFDI